MALPPLWGPIVGGGGGAAPGLPNIWVNPPPPAEGPEGAAGGIPEGVPGNGICGEGGVPAGADPGAGA